MLLRQKFIKAVDLGNKKGFCWQLMRQKESWKAGRSYR